MSPIKGFLLLTAVLVAVLPGVSAAEPLAPRGDDLTDEQRREIQERLDNNIAELKRLGLLSEAPPTLLATHPTLDWPLRAPAISDPGYHYMVSFVDHNPSFPNAVLDYACGTRTYDTAAGYNHQGSDFALDPFPWLRVEEGEVEIIAAAPGTIIGKDDGYPDHSCSMNSLPWNAVYIQHSDGSVAWYGHMKTGSTTTKAVGETVARGEYLGHVGSSGNSDRPHLHLEVYDSSGALNDPYQGACNNFNATSWWANQRPYTDSAINRIGVGFTSPIIPGCSREDPKEAADYNPGDRIVFTAYYRDQAAAQSATNVVHRPDGTAYATWTDSFTLFQSHPFYLHAIFNFGSGQPVGIWRYDVTYLGITYSRNFRLSAASGSGRVPGELQDETPFTVNKSGADLSLAWTASCVTTDTDYEVYEGNIGDWTSHTSKLCSTGGTTSATFASPAGSTYYLVVPTDTSREGSYGWNRQFVERPTGLSSCHPQVIGGNCPRCGDSVLEPPEVCDRNLLNGHTCVTEGFTDGVLACGADCESFDTSGCF